MVGPIVLVNGQFDKPRVVEPLSILSLSAYLKSKGYEVILYDPQLSAGQSDHVHEILRCHPQFIGISVITYRNRETILEFIRTLRKRKYTGCICVGGHDPSVDWDKYLAQSSDLDVVVIGEGEFTLTELLESLNSKTDWHRIPGIAFRDVDGRIVRTEPRLLCDIDRLPYLDRTILLELLSKHGKAVIPYISLLAGRGCYANCSFCAVMAYYDLQAGPRFRLRSIDRILDEMMYAYNLTGLTSFYFADDNFLMRGPKRLERIEHFYRGVQQLPFKIEFLQVNTRVNDISRPVLNLLKKSGMERISIGVESFLDEDLQLYRKNISSKKIQHVFQILEQEGFSAAPGSRYRVKTTFIVFNPYTSTTGLREQLRWFKRYHISPKKLGTKLFVYPHTKIHAEFSEAGLLKAEGNFTFINPEVEQIYENYSQGLDLAMPLRDRIRLLEKITSDIGKAFEFQELGKRRRLIDDACYQLFEDLIHAGIQKTIDASILESWWEKLQARIRIDELTDLVHKAEVSFSVESLTGYGH